VKTQYDIDERVRSTEELIRGLQVSLKIIRGVKSDDISAEELRILKEIDRLRQRVDTLIWVLL
jgi:Ni,Fe-hydrogenase III large subunit